MQTLELAVREPLLLKVGGREYVVEFPLPSVVWLEKKLGRSMKVATDWWRMTTEELPDILRAGLLSKHEAEADEITALVLNALDAEGINAVMDSVCVVAFPRATAKFKEELDKIRERVKAGLPIKNGLSADAS